MLSCTHNDDLADGNCIITHANNHMTSSMSSVVHYDLLNCDTNEMMEQDHEVENNEYFSLSSSIPTIVYTNDFNDESIRWESLSSIYNLRFNKWWLW